MSGAIMPEPLTIPASCTVLPPTMAEAPAPLAKGIGGADGDGGIFPSARFGGENLRQPGLGLVDRQWHADNPGGADEHVRWLAVKMMRHPRHDGFPPPGAR